MDLPGKIALVTGGAHRVGREIALALAHAGCHLAIHYHHSEKAAKDTASTAQTLGENAAIFRADLSKLDQIDGLFGLIDSEFGALDVLVNSAAIMKKVGFQKADEDDWHNTIDLNMKAPFFCIQKAAERMRINGAGAIVNISDIAGLRPWRDYPLHSISKTGLEMLTKVAALAYAPEVRVNAVAPGPVLKPDKMSDTRWREIGGVLPLQRSGSAADIARAVIFLLENDFITGETLVVDGGNQLV
ncbi:MAG: SDR family oxidoreductase [Anaerolineales bacterium]|nr:SDR family oxidoreductase [Anaerolineales bacterium]